MLKITENIRSLYAINLVEGEGVGTAYEYYVKLRKLERFVNSIERPKRILIAGLPERYGLSMDFFLLGQMLQAETVAIDERSDALERAGVGHGSAVIVLNLRQAVKRNTQGGEMLYQPSQLWRGENPICGGK